MSYYRFENNPEFHVWDLETYKDIDSVSRFKNSWMKTFIKPEDAVMDIGCGPGYNVKILQDNGIKVLGVDLNEDSVKRAQTEGLNVERIDAIEAIEKYGHLYNFFYMSDFVEHVPLEVVLEVFTKLSKLKNITVYMCTPNLDSLMGFKFWFHMPTHINAMHPYVINKMLSNLNFKILDQWSEYGNLPGRGWKLKFRKFILDKLFGTQATLFTGGANICYLVRSSS